MPSQKCGKKCIKEPSGNTNLPVVKDHHLHRGLRIIILEKFKRITYIVNLCNRSTGLVHTMILYVRKRPFSLIINGNHLN